MLDEAGGFKGDKITLSYNADGGHKEWTEATCNSIKQALGVDCVATGVVDFATFRAQIGDEKMKGMFRSGWQMDYPSIENFLAPLLQDGRVLERRQLLQPGVRQARSTRPLRPPTRLRPTPCTSRPRLSSRRTCRQIPMYYGKTTMGWSDKVSGVKITAFGTVDYTQVSLK